MSAHAACATDAARRSPASGIDGGDDVLRIGSIVGFDGDGSTKRRVRP